MAKVFTDATAASSDNFNIMVFGGDDDTAFQIIACHINYDGANWQVDTGEGSINHAVIIEAGCTWDGTADELDIDISGLTGDSKRPFSIHRPVCVVSATASSGASGTDANHYPQARASAADAIRIRWYDDATGDQITTEDIQMDCQLIMFGVIGSI
ncbi:MAG: hypothetical protein GY906_18080 [bacterium]|nr:hypothetical protein [bacterium]